jgi:ATP-dependent helicase/nuclease subunit A
MVNAAAEFDSRGERDCNAFSQFINSYEMHEPPGSNAVSVMTIHQAKGLGFDVVVLPDLQKVDMGTARHRDFVLKCDRMEKLEWVLKMPHKVVARNDAVLAACLRSADETACFDALCVLYVALTRARQGLYMITSPPARSASSFPPAALLKMQLGGEDQAEKSLSGMVEGGKSSCLYERGERYWYGEEKREEVEGGKGKEVELPAGFNKFPAQRRSLLNVIPSAEMRMEKSAHLLFAKTARGGRELGTAVHELFERVSWYGEVDMEELVQEWLASSSAGRDVKKKAVEQFRRALESVDVQQALSRPHGDARLWREKRFEVVLDDRWLTGVFDRVVVVRDEEGKLLSATVVDFKSDEVVFALEVPGRAEKYRVQMLLYRDALSRILQVAPDRITLRLLFTCPGKVYDFE